MVVTEGFRQYVLEQLEQVVPVRLRRMFGGVGVYSQGFFLALMDNDTLFFKVDEANRADYEARGMGAFRPFGDDRMSMQYYELPAEILEDTGLLRIWVRESVTAAMRKSAQKRSLRGKIVDARSPARKPAKRKARARATAGKTVSKKKNSSGGRTGRSVKMPRGGGSGRRG